MLGETGIHKQEKEKFRTSLESLQQAQIFFQETNCRLITAYLLLRVNWDTVMHMHQDFDVLSAQGRKVNAPGGTQYVGPYGDVPPTWVANQPLGI